MATQIIFWRRAAGEALVRDADHLRLLTDNPEALARFRGQLRYLHLHWNRWYVEFLAEYRQSLDRLIADIEAYLRAHDVDPTEVSRPDERADNAAPMRGVVPVKPGLKHRLEPGVPRHLHADCQYSG